MSSVHRVKADGEAGYLVNSTSVSSPLDLTVPASVGPSGDYYSIAIADLTSGKTSTYSNHFNLTGGTGQYTDYEQHLGGAPFWDANALPCSSYACARQCAQSSYPNDLSDSSAYDTMKTCILNCPGVQPAVNQTGPAHASGTSSAQGQQTTASASEALITLGAGVVMTAMETVVTSDGSTLTEAVLGSRTIVLGGAAATLSSQTFSLASNGVEIGSSTTVPFSAQSATVTSGGSATFTNARAAATSSSKGASSRQGIAMAGVVGGAAALALLIV